MKSRYAQSLLWFIAALSVATSPAAQEGVALSDSAKSLTELQKRMWNDPSFQKQFVESFLAETDIEPRVDLDERETMQEILQLIASDKLSEAEQMLLTSIGQQPDTPKQPERQSLFSKSRQEDTKPKSVSAVFDFTLANIYFQQEKLDQAIDVYRHAIGKFPKFRRAWKNLALIYVRQGALDKAIPALTRVIELGGTDAVTYGLLGYGYGSTEKHLEAESAYRMAILLDPETLDWKMGLARSFFKQQRYAEAAVLCGQLLKDNPERADLWLLQANAYIGLSEPLKAAENYEIVQRLGQATADVLNTLGDIYINEELYDIAAGAYVSAMEKASKTTPERAIRSAKALVARGAFAETRRVVEKTEQVYGAQMTTDQRKDILKLNARLAVAEGAGSAEEVRILKELVELDPLDGEALILLGQHSSRSGDVEKAEFYFERASSIEAYEADAKVRHAQLLVGQGKYEQALPLLRRAQQIKPRESIQQYLEQVERVSRTR
ncbi:MAG TPA: tetratricopeptide repeat protein [bacterium]|nr:tetratricopeptide repeat protein [bacterium]